MDTCVMIGNDGVRDIHYPYILIDIFNDMRQLPNGS
jgi:hypothetical protein